MLTDKKDIIIIGGGIIGLACAHYLMDQGVNVTMIYSSRLFRQLFDNGALACDFEDKGVLTAYLPPKAYEGFHRANAFNEQFGLGYKKLSRQETMEFSVFSTSLNRNRLNKLIKGAAEYMQTPLDRPIVEEWAGVRPMTYDDMPVIGRMPGFSNMVVAAGHGMLVSDLILEKQPEIDPAPLSPDRFN